MKKPFLIFDFDGTLAQTFEAILEILRPMAKDVGLGEISNKDIREFRERGSRQMIKELKIPLFKIPGVSKKVKEKLNKDMTNLDSPLGLNKVLKELKKRKYRLGILTSNSKDNVKKFLQKNGLDLFEFIYSDSSLFGKDRVLKKLLKAFNLKPEEVVYFGDEIRDVQAALKLNIKMVAVSWGFNTKKALKKYKPASLIEKPAEILTLFSEA